MNGKVDSDINHICLGSPPAVQHKCVISIIIRLITAATGKTGTGYRHDVHTYHFDSCLDPVQTGSHTCSVFRSSFCTN